MHSGDSLKLSHSYEKTADEYRFRLLKRSTFFFNTVAHSTCEVTRLHTSISTQVTSNYLFRVKLFDLGPSVDLKHSHTMSGIKIVQKIKKLF